MDGQTDRKYYAVAVSCLTTRWKN